MLGVAIFLYPTKNSAFKLAKDIRWLGAFGVLHGINEWIDMFELIYETADITLIHSVHLTVLSCSFLSLFIFGTKSITEIKKKYAGLNILSIALFAVWMTATIISSRWILMGDIWSRYLLGIPGIFLTSYALILQIPELQEMKFTVVVRNIKLSAVAFAFYGIFAGLIVPAAGFFPASFLNYGLFLDKVGVPVQVFRTFMAVVMTYGITRVLGMFELETMHVLQNSHDRLEVLVKERTAELMAANERLKESEEKFRSLVEASSDCICHIDNNGNVTYMNPAGLKLHRMGRNEIAGVSCIEMVKPEYRDALKEIIEKAKNGKTANFQYEAETVLGSRWFDSVFTPVKNASGDIVSLLRISRDVTNQKQFEEEQERLRNLESIGILAGGIAHDFNNLLTVILGNVSLVKMPLKPVEKAFGELTDAENACLQARELSYRLLTFAKGGEPLKKVVSIPPILKKTADFLRGAYNVDCELHIAEDMHPVAIDEEQIVQVFANMLINAKEAMHEGGVVKIKGINTVILEEHNFPMGHGDYIQISIEDSGGGIPKEHIPKIFDPYFSTKEKGPRRGLGLGLAICHSIIKRHDGYITVESEVGRGTTFHIYLPAAEN